MKQGRATTSMVGSTKTEPVSRVVSPGAVSRMGTIVAPGTTPTIRPDKEKSWATSWRPVPSPSRCTKAEA